MQGYLKWVTWIFSSVTMAKSQRGLQRVPNASPVTIPIPGSKVSSDHVYRIRTITYVIRENFTRLPANSVRVNDPDLAAVCCRHR